MAHAYNEVPRRNRGRGTHRHRQISLGHPIGANGARMVTSASYELRRGGGIGVLSMCAGGGMGAAMVIEVV